MASDIYNPLQPGHIRLLRLLPGTWNEALAGELFEANQSTPYTALSYTWGNRQCVSSIVLKGKAKPITANLDLALRTLREPRAPILVWADAICINQDDTEEKGAQVSFMHHTFGWATEVRAYVCDGLARGVSYSHQLKKLGPPERVEFPRADELLWEDIERALSLLERESPARFPLEQRWRCIAGLLQALSSRALTKRLRTMDLFSKDRSTEMEDRLLHLFEWLRVFAVAPWWNRMWITQEAGVARSLQLVFGKTTMPFPVLENAVNDVKSKTKGLNLGQDHQKVLDLLASNVRTISELRRFQRYGSLAQMRSPDYFRRSLGSRLLWLLRTFRHRHSSEPLDKIFALNQLLVRLDDGDGRHSIVTVDYKGSVSTVFCQVAFKIIQDTGLFWITSLDLAAKIHDDLPSWVPNWTDGFTAPDLDNLAWKVRLCHNASGIKYKVTRINEILEMEPYEYYKRMVDGDAESRLWKRIRGPDSQEKQRALHGGLGREDEDMGVAYSKQIYLGSNKKPTDRRLRHERYCVKAQEYTGIAHCLGISSQTCGAVFAVSEPIAADLSNLLSIIIKFRFGLDTLTDAHVTPPPTPLCSPRKYHEIGSALCFGAVLEPLDTVRRVKADDEAGLAMLVHLLTDRLLTDEYRLWPWLELEEKEDYCRRSRTKLAWENRRACTECSKPPATEPCDACVRNANERPVLSASDARRDEEIRRYYRTALQTAPGNCLLVMYDGRLALGPPQTQRNDDVHILSGGLCPYILRREPTSEYVRYKTYRLVGDCYVSNPPRWATTPVQMIGLV